MKLVCEICGNEYENKKYKHVLPKIIECKMCSNLRRYKQFITSHKTKIWTSLCSNCGKECKYTDYRNRWRAKRDGDVCRYCRHILQPVERTTKMIKKWRLTRTSNIKKLKWRPTYNPKACQIFDEINLTLNWNGLHAENGGEFFIKELGYWLDFYDPIQNVVIEYDEIHHNRRKLQERDKIRQQEIIEHLNCQFYRIKDGQDWREAVL